MQLDKDVLSIILKIICCVIGLVGIILGAGFAYSAWKSPDWATARQVVLDMRAKYPESRYYTQQFDLCIVESQYPFDEARLICQHKGRLAAENEQALRNIQAYDEDVLKHLLSAKLDYPPSHVMEQE